MKIYLDNFFIAKYSTFTVKSYQKKNIYDKITLYYKKRILVKYINEKNFIFSIERIIKDLKI